MAAWSVGTVDACCVRGSIALVVGVFLLPLALFGCEAAIVGQMDWPRTAKAYKAIGLVTAYVVVSSSLPFLLYLLARPKRP